MADRYHAVNGLKRGLAIIAAMSEAGEGTVLEIARQTSIPRPTVHRIIVTLMGLGYVAKTARTGRYRITSKMRELALRSRDSDELLDIAEPVLSRLSADVVWPTDIATYRDLTMEIRVSTHQRSPLSIHGSVTGARFPMLMSSLGLTYLAFSRADVRDEIIRQLKSAGLTYDHSLTEIKRLLSGTKARGYGLRQGAGVTRTSSFAVPIMHNGRIEACLCMVWIHSALSTAVVVKRYLPRLQAAAQDISAAWSAAEIPDRKPV